MTRYLGVDYGSKRIGLAIGDDRLRIASPLETISSAGGPVRDAEEIAARAANQGAMAIVVGVPINMDGTEGPQAALTRRFIDALKARAQVPVFEQDERLSSFAADEALESTTLTPRQRAARRDMLAAQCILQAYLDSSPRS